MRDTCRHWQRAALAEGAPAWGEAELDSHRLSPSQREDLAQLLPYLACGEVSAVLALTGRLLRALPPSAQVHLRRMAQDEQRHAHLIEAIAQTLPAPRQAEGGARTAMFFRRLQAHAPAQHLAHIAALDRAVCRLLHPLLRRGGAISAAPRLHRALAGLRQDEARHVGLTRALAQQLGCAPAQQAELNRAIEARLHALLQPAQAAIARLSAPVGAPCQEDAR